MRSLPRQDAARRRLDRDVLVVRLPRVHPRTGCRHGRLAEVARAVDLHPVYLGQLFTREIRQTLGDFVNDLRVRAAAEALSSGSIPLAEIAIENGFYDQSHFSRTFSRKVGVSPGAFRRRYHGARELED